ncbi:Tex family protein [Desulfofustis limnaeus]|uniref:RNA-binding transcriptional accessory protein n=1 Tax=Desulfofustis limnaeus TaxID=2740163 RepID=A0ABM7W964_9BACT|nr:Tex family protein [Desulfofustis limnaeus]BDD87479.1 RNA-binding transcriptional accessory protein [Desulfofustis limnaeus]
MHDTFYARTAQHLAISATQVAAAATLFDAGATVPFIARYRKEMTGSLDEIQLLAIRDSLARQAELEKRRSAIIASLQERTLLTDDLLAAVKAAETMTILEDVYLPWRPKRRTRAAIARERGLEPLAESLLRGTQSRSLSSYITADGAVPSTEQALAGARDIIAERISEDVLSRRDVRTLFRSTAVIHARAVEKNRDNSATYRDYFDWREPVRKIASHRLHALFRGEQEKALTLTIRPEEKAALKILQRRWLKNPAHHNQLLAAIEDGYRRLLAPSLETELRRELKERADTEAIAVFAANVRELLLAPPLGQKRVMALDPGYRTGAKLVCLDSQGALLEHTTIYPTQGEKQRLAAAHTVEKLVHKHGIEAVAVGSGTAGRETESFVRECGLEKHIVVTLVNEDGASVYSASATARREFPDLDVTVRGAISIGRRLQDPLAELVKIDPKSIGVGQYQHDVNQSALAEALEAVVTSCVNNVGVELNTASSELLSFVSGIGPALAANIVARRLENGPFRSRRDLLGVPRLGAKAFEQAAGFLRISDGTHPLDASAVHPERYQLVEQMAADLGVGVKDLMTSNSLRQSIDLSRYRSDSVGEPTLVDILAELAKPGRDPRESFTSFAFAEGIAKIEDLRPGMILPGLITNVTSFGAFADIGVHRDGLIHISQLADRFISDPADVVRVRQRVTVRVLDVDLERKRINLSLRGV